MASNGTKMFTVDKFLGINESGDGDTELRMGEASRMENFFITDAYNIALRPGVQRVDFNQIREPAPILAAWAGYAGGTEFLVICDFYEGNDRLFAYGKQTGGGYELLSRQSAILGLTSEEDACVSIFSFNGDLYVMSSVNTAVYGQNGFAVQDGYIPLVAVAAPPSGGGATLENLNMLSSKRRMTFSADGTATAYVLPEEATDVVRILIDNVEYAVATAGSFDTLLHTFNFNTAPVTGVGNVEITYDTDHDLAEASKRLITSCRLHEEYNGSTDTRLFAAGNGTNLCHYTGVTQEGIPSALYFPAMNEVAVDMSGSDITGLIRHYSKLLVFKEDGTYSISYEPVTLTDGSTVAGFYLRPMNAEYGNETMGQVQTVNNYPRTITKDGIYEWRITSSYYKDERYANRISDVVQKTMRSADVRNMVTCDDDYGKTYYVFLNDDAGTVLVNRYDLGKTGAWCVYRGDLFRNVKYAMMMGGEMIFANETEVFCMNQNQTKDAPVQAGDETQQIKAVWESGFMHFGADFRRKYSSIIYLSVLPQSNSEIIITAETDKRADYMEKTVTNNVFYWPNADFVNWTFNTNDRPTINRVRLKVKKFVYYRLIIRIEKEGAVGTVLGFDQQIRFASMAK